MEEVEEEYTNHKNKIFGLIREIRSKKKVGLLLVFGSLPALFKKGAHPLGKISNDKKEMVKPVCSIYNKEAKGELLRIGCDGAVLIDEFGLIYEPSVYLNVNIEKINKNKIKQDYNARHIAALVTSTLTGVTTFTLSENNRRIREFYNGKVVREHPKNILRDFKKRLKKFSRFR